MTLHVQGKNPDFTAPGTEYQDVSRLQAGCQTVTARWVHSKVLARESAVREKRQGDESGRRV
jgi:hypothetical protein